VAVGLPDRLEVVSFRHTEGRIAKRVVAVTAGGLNRSWGLMARCLLTRFGTRGARAARSTRGRAEAMMEGVEAKVEVVE
jgi:hypothetical protein